jgi:excisionase family DNA binding protein
VSGDEDLSLAEAAEHAGLHYMTMYRYVRTGRIPATREGREWRITRHDLDALRAPPVAVTPGRKPSTISTARRLEARILAGDEPGAWRIVEDNLASGAEPAAVLLRLVVPALASVGDRWSRGDIRIADEHRASAVAGRLIARLGPLLRPRGPRRGTVIVGAVTYDRHALPSAIAADLLRGAGYDVVDLGADVPVESYLHATTDAPRLRAVVVSVATLVDPGALATIVETVHTVAPVPVLVGGPACSAAVASRAGADAHVALDDLVEQVRELAG